MNSLTQFETDLLTGTNEGIGGTEDADDAFVAGLAALHIDGSFRIGTIHRNNPDLNFGVAELPAGPDGSRHTFGSYWTHGITRRAAADDAGTDPRSRPRPTDEAAVRATRPTQRQGPSSPRRGGPN